VLHHDNDLTRNESTIIIIIIYFFNENERLCAGMTGVGGGGGVWLLTAKSCIECNARENRRLNRFESTCFINF